MKTGTRSNQAPKNTNILILINLFSINLAQIRFAKKDMHKKYFVCQQSIGAFLTVLASRLAGLGITAAVLVWGGRAEAGLRLIESRVNAGVVLSGRLSTNVFLLTNDSPRVSTVFGVDVDCQCTTATLTNSVVPAHGSIGVTVVVDASARPVQDEHTLLFRTDSGVLRGSLEMQVRYGLRAFPQGVRMQRQFGRSATTNVVLRLDPMVGKFSAADFEVEPSERLAIRTALTAGTQTGECRLQLTLDGVNPLVPGIRAGSVRVVHRASGQSTVIFVTIAADGSVVIEPAELNLGFLDGNSPAEAVVRVRGTDLRQAVQGRIEAVEQPGVRTELVPQADGSMRLSVRLERSALDMNDKSLPPSVRFILSRPETEIYDIPVIYAHPSTNLCCGQPTTKEIKTKKPIEP